MDWTAVVGAEGTEVEAGTEVTEATEVTEEPTGGAAEAGGMEGAGAVFEVVLGVLVVGPRDVGGGAEK